MCKDRYGLKPGDRVQTIDRAVAQILQETQDGQWILVWYIESAEDPSMVGTEDLCHQDECGGFGIDFCVTKSAVNHGSVNLAVDFLQFITTPQNDGYVVNEQPQYVVAVKGAPDKSGLGRFFGGEKDMVKAFTYGISIYNTLNTKWSAKIDEIATEYFQGQRSLDSALHRLDIEARQQAQAELQLHDKTKSKLGMWDTSKW